MGDPWPQCLSAKDEDAHTQRASILVHIIKLLKQNKYLTEETPCVDVFDFDILADTVKLCHDALPNMRHFFAVKACPLTGVMKKLLKLGMGAECASITEVEHALAMGFPPDRVCFDSPAKMQKEIVRAIEAGCVMNCDGSEEIEKVNELITLGTLKAEDMRSSKRVGVRINPCQKAGSIAMSSTAHRGSKFGLQIHADNRTECIALIQNNPWIRGLHMHVGSQGIELQQLVTAARAIVDIAKDIGCLPGTDEMQISFLDLGGGISVDYMSEKLPEFSSYASLLREQVPELFEEKKFENLYTEFGRSIVCKSGTSFTTVESVKMTIQEGVERPTALCHLGSNHFLRPVYASDKYSHRISVHKPPSNDGTSVPFQFHDIAGPLCFSGDVIANKRWLPSVARGDVLAIHDTGAYCYSMYSRYNSRPAPPVVAITRTSETHPSSDALVLTVVKAGETLADIIRFWS
eukprot:m.259021 g.259021  ORF g.259021 m.259021 type:complete len:462 (+) comp16200_c0_seq12:3218-4603(+)